MPSALRSLNTVPEMLPGAYSPALTTVALPELTVTAARPVAETTLLGRLPLGEKLSPSILITCTL